MRERLRVFLSGWLDEEKSNPRAWDDDRHRTLGYLFFALAVVLLAILVLGIVVVVF